MYDKRHPKIIISFLIFSLLLAALFFLTGATVYAATQDMQKLKQDTEEKIQNAQSETEVREIYQEFEKQAASLNKVQSSNPVKRAVSQSPEKNEVSSSKKNTAVKTQNTASTAQTYAVKKNTVPSKTETASASRKQNIKRKKSAVRHAEPKPIKKVPVKNIKRNHPVRAEQKEMNSCPALVVISLFLAFAMVRLSVFSGSGIEITYITLSKKEVRKRK